MGFWTTVAVDFAIWFWFFGFFNQFLFFVRSISGDNYMKFFVQQEAWSALLFLWTLVRFPKESPNDWEGFTFCASVSNFNNLPSFFLLFIILFF